MYCGSSFHRTNWLYASDHAARPLCGLQITTLHCHQPKYRQQMLAHSHGLYSILTLIICHFHPLPSCSCLLLHIFWLPHRRQSAKLRSPVLSTTTYVQDLLLSLCSNALGHLLSFQISQYTPPLSNCRLPIFIVHYPLDLGVVSSSLSFCASPFLPLTCSIVPTSPCLQSPFSSISLDLPPLLLNSLHAQLLPQMTNIPSSTQGYVTTSLD